ncbi:MAG: Smc5-6 complex non-SMC subunit Nse4 [Amphiamblys sp. WSBS2006]|nr:MAG: Smc5-6 complex non-SMC subunit Nse4 [Amphiamblys sp. WSBS2006]
MKEKNLKEFYQSLLTEIHEKKDELVSPMSKRLCVIVQKANEEHKNIASADTAKQDSTLIVQSSALGKKKTQSLSMYGLTFTAEMFLDSFCRFNEERLRTRLRYSPDKTEPVVESSSLDPKTLSRTTLRCSKTVLLNAATPFSSSSPTLKNTKKPLAETKTQIHGGDLPKQKADQLPQTEEDSTAGKVYKIFKNLKKHSPIALLSFATDPASFAKTVENLFHLSFLVKDEKAILIENEDEENTLLRTVIAIQENSQSPDRRNSFVAIAEHKILTITWEEWNSLRENKAVAKAHIN